MNNRQKQVRALQYLAEFEAILAFRTAYPEEQRAADAARRLIEGTLLFIPEFLR